MKHSYFLMLGLLLFAATLNASNEEGTGINSVQIIPDNSGRLVLQAQQDGYSLIGSANTELNYGELILDQLESNGVLTPEWGKAEVLLGCYQADVLLYQKQAQDWVEVAAMQVETAYCAQ